MSKSSASVSSRLEGHFKRLSVDIVNDYRDTLHAGTPEAVATYRETFVQSIISRFFPRTHHVAKGAIYDSHGCRSASIDCVVCAQNHPLFLDSMGRIATLLADGVQCAIEIKPDLTDLPEAFGENRVSKQKPEIVRALEQVRSVKRLTRISSLPNLMTKKWSPEYRDHNSRIPTYVFTIEPVDLNALCSYIANYYLHNSVPPSEQVDVVLVVSVGVIRIMKAPEFGTPNSAKFRPIAVAFHSKERALEHFIMIATGDHAPEMRISEPILNAYLDRSQMSDPALTHGYFTTPDVDMLPAAGGQTTNTEPQP